MEDLSGYAVALRTLAADWTEVANNIARSAQAIDDMVIGVHATWHGRAYDSLHAYWAMYGPGGGLNFQLRQLERAIRELAARLDGAARDLQVQVDHIVDDQNAAHLRQALFMGGLVALNVAAVLLTVPTGGFSDVAAGVADEAFLGSEAVAAMEGGSGSGIRGLVGDLASEFRGLDSGMRAIVWTDVNAEVTAEFKGDPLNWSVGDDALVAGAGLATAARLPGVVTGLAGRLRATLAATDAGTHVAVRAATFARQYPYWWNFSTQLAKGAGWVTIYDLLTKEAAAGGWLGAQERQPFTWDRYDTIQIFLGPMIGAALAAPLSGLRPGTVTHRLIPGSVADQIRPAGTLGGKLDRLAFRVGGPLESFMVNFPAAVGSSIFRDVVVDGVDPDWIKAVDFGLFAGGYAAAYGAARAAAIGRWGVFAPNARGESMVVGPPILRFLANSGNSAVVSSATYIVLVGLIPDLRHLIPQYRLPSHPSAPPVEPLIPLPAIATGMLPVPSVSASPPTLPTPLIHRVAPGETLAAIIAQAWGPATPDDIRAIAALDHIANPDHLGIGQPLVIPVR